MEKTEKIELQKRSILDLLLAFQCIQHNTLNSSTMWKTSHVSHCEPFLWWATAVTKMRILRGRMEIWSFECQEIIHNWAQWTSECFNTHERLKIICHHFHILSRKRLPGVTYVKTSTLQGIKGQTSWSDKLNNSIMASRVAYIISPFFTKGEQKETNEIKKQKNSNVGTFLSRDQRWLSIINKSSLATVHDQTKLND